MLIPLISHAQATVLSLELSVGRWDAFEHVDAHSDDLFDYFRTQPLAARLAGLAERRKRFGSPEMLLEELEHARCVCCSNDAAPVSMFEGARP